MEKIKEIIDMFCEIILTDKDFIDNSLADEYINSLDEHIAKLNSLKEPEKNHEIRAYLLNNIMLYIRKYQENGLSVGVPFSFDSGTYYVEYRNYFTKKYQEKNKNADLPPIFDFAFDYIQEVSEHYRIFLGFYDTRSNDTIETALSKVRSFAQEVVNDSAKQAAKEAAKEATKNATELADKALTSANRAKLDAESAAENAVNSAMGKMTMKMSETSVTILGIFAGIVLTVVAGLFYSSSVLESVNTADFTKLISVSALIGLVCFNLVALMFRYIERIRHVSATTPRFDKITRFITWALIIIMLLFAGIHLWNSEDKNIVSDKNESNVNITIKSDKNQTESKNESDVIEQNNVTDKDASGHSEKLNKE